MVVLFKYDALISGGISAMKKYMKVALATKRKPGKPTKKVALDNYLMVSLW